MENKDHLLQYTIPQLLRWRVQATGDKVALREKDFGTWISYTWKEYYDLVRKACLGLGRIGLKKGDEFPNQQRFADAIRASIYDCPDTHERLRPSRYQPAAQGLGLSGFQ